MKAQSFLFAIIVIFWSLSLYFYTNPILYDSLEWLKIAFSLTIVSVLELFSFIRFANHTSFKKGNIIFIAVSIISIIIALFPFVNKNFQNYLIGLHPLSFIFLLILICYAGLGGAIIFDKFLKTSRNQYLAADSLQKVYILISFGLFVFAIMVLYLILPLVGIKNYFWLGPVFAFIFTLCLIVNDYFTKKRQTKKEKENLEREWQELNKAKDQFLLFIQHHLRTPITPVKGYLERILDGTYGREENPVIKEKLIEIKKLVDTIYSLIETLIEIQELKMGKKKLNIENFQIEKLIDGVVEELKPEAEKKGLYLKFEKPKNLTPTIRADKKMIQEAIWNLVDNAIKYTNKGEVIIRLEKLKNKIRIMISDTGIGMAKEKIDYFLEGKLFERGEEAKELYGPGKGVGLTIAVEFIKANGGKIWAESESQNKGTTFWIEFLL